ncbi:hypothetical protein INT45_009953 [Circinella minor]|uniref:Uncharacterized protein n=1 Tax=Circinella minor TaxID=1195481 RepID=A0A8H7RX99_9FUNG|nr:hypothetical protein INT45_009953 [Circinella minor]
MIKPYQWAALLLYPLTVLFLSSTLAGHIPPSYFSNSHNIFNVYFVKLGWLWTTLAFSSLLIFQPTTTTTTRTTNNNNKLLQSLGRYICMTLYWIVMTQWLLGPSFVDRMFVATGGSCHFENTSSPLIAAAINKNMILQQATCRSSGGRWHGGHDVSGHCVLLIHASLFLLEELMHIKQGNKRKQVFIIGLLGLWYWMLAMTSIYFHGYRELLSGTFFGILGWVILMYII